MLNRLLTLAVITMLLSACGDHKNEPPEAKSVDKSSIVANQTQKILIIYDGHGNDLDGKYGLINAIMLESVLGHFDVSVDLLPVEAYRSKAIDRYSATFYLGSYFDNTLPNHFLTDVVETSQTVIWFKYNIWSLSSKAGFANKYGVIFDSFRSLDARPSVSNPNPGFFDTVSYKNKSMMKHYEYDSVNNVVSADPDVGIIKIQDPSKTKVYASIKNSKTNEIAPYVVQANNFWYVADIPFSFIGPRDRYLVLCDLLHDMLGVDHPESHKALARLEDVNASVNYSSIKKLADWMSDENVPFSIAAIPHYKDPLGKYTGGVPTDLPLAQSPNLLRALHYAATKGGSIVAHGFTHQYGNVQNPQTGVSGDDFEFWDTTRNAPVIDDSFEWALGRVDAATQEFAEQNLTPFAWEAPHYKGSPVDYRAFVARYPITYHRVSYFTSENPVALETLNPNRDITASLYFPYPVKSDHYGQKIIPENLGSINFNISGDPNDTNITWQDLVQNADYALVVRDGYASFFFHPFWLEPELNLPQAFPDFKSLVNGIRALGYEFVPAQDTSF